MPDFEGDVDYAPMWAGISVSDLHEPKPAAQIVADLVRERRRSSPRRRPSEG